MKDIKQCVKKSAMLSQDKSRVKTIRKVILESQYYSMFRTTIRMLLDEIENMKRLPMYTACNSFLFFTIHFIFQFYTCIYLEVSIAVLLLFRCKFCIITCLPFATTVTL